MLAQQFPWVKQMKIFWHIEQKGILKITTIYIRVEKRKHPELLFGEMFPKTT